MLVMKYFIQSNLVNQPWAILKAYQIDEVCRIYFDPLEEGDEEERTMQKMTKFKER